MSHVELDSFFDEGILLSEDMDLVGGLSGYTNSASSLVVERIATRWGFKRTLARENLSIEDMWDTFLEWLHDLALKIKDAVNNAVGKGRSALRKQRSLEEGYHDFKQKAVHPSSGNVSTATYAQQLMIHDTFDPRGCEDIAKHLPKTVDDITEWSRNSIKEAANVLEMVQSVTRRFDTVSELNYNKIAASTVTNFNVFIGKRIDRNLGSFAGSKDIEEKQLLWGLPGNAYIQYYLLYYNGKEMGKELPIEGTRYIIPNFKSTPDRELNGEERALPFDILYETIRALKPLASTLLELETSNAYIQREIDKLRRVVVTRQKDKRSVSVAERYAYRLARERLMTANNSLRAVLHTLRNLVEGNLARIAAHQKAHLSAN